MTTREHPRSMKVASNSTQVTWMFLHPTPSRKLHERFYTPPLHASYMHVITPHPTPSRKLHERYYTPPHPTPPHPFPPRGTPAPKGVYIYRYYNCHHHPHLNDYRGVDPIFRQTHLDVSEVLEYHIYGLKSFFVHSISRILSLSHPWECLFTNKNSHRISSTLARWAPRGTLTSWLHEVSTPLAKAWNDMLPKWANDFHIPTFGTGEPFRAQRTPKNPIVFPCDVYQYHPVG